MRYRRRVMPLSLRIPREKEKAIKNAASKAGKTKTTFILEAVDEKLGIRKDREQTIRALAGWMSHEEAEALRREARAFDTVNPGDWE
jgi:predicted DNA-binding protein